MNGAATHVLTTEPLVSTATTARIESIGVRLPRKRLTTAELMASTKHRTRIDLERLTGIHERRVVEPGDDSLTLAVGAARDCLRKSRYDGGDLDMVICTSITRYAGGFRQRLEPALSLSIKQAIGAPDAASFDLSNACAGMLTGVFILNDYIRRGVIRRGMVVSGESISQLGRNAATRVRSIFSRQLASLTLGDAGAAVIVDGAPQGDEGIGLAAFTTLAEHSRLCLAYPSKIGPGASMYTKSRSIHKVAIDNVPALLGEALEVSGLSVDDIDVVIPHQTSARAIRSGTKALAAKLGMAPKCVIENVENFGNTSSTTHFVALHRLLQEGRLKPDDRVLLLALASGLEVGVVVFSVGELAGA